MRADNIKRRHYFIPLLASRMWLPSSPNLECCKTCGCVFSDGLHCFPPLTYTDAIQAVIEGGNPVFRPVHVTDQLALLEIRGDNVVRSLMAAGMVECVQRGRSRHSPALYRLTEWGTEYLNRSRVVQYRAYRALAV